MKKAINLLVISLLISCAKDMVEETPSGVTTEFDYSQFSKLTVQTGVVPTDTARDEHNADPICSGYLEQVEPYQGVSQGISYELISKVYNDNGLFIGFKQRIRNAFSYDVEFSIIDGVSIETILQQTKIIQAKTDVYVITDGANILLKVDADGTSGLAPSTTPYGATIPDFTGCEEPVVITTSTEVFATPECSSESEVFAPYSGGNNIYGSEIFIADGSFFEENGLDVAIKFSIVNNSETALVVSLGEYQIGDITSSNEGFEQEGSHFVAHYVSSRPLQPQEQVYFLIPLGIDSEHYYVEGILYSYNGNVIPNNRVQSCEAGTLVESGEDTNGNGVLDPEEVTSSEMI